MQLLVHSAALDHEALDHPVEDGAVVVLVLHILEEVGHRHRRLLLVELHLDVAHAGSDHHRHCEDHVESLSMPPM